MRSRVQLALGAPCKISVEIASYGAFTIRRDSSVFEEVCSGGSRFEPVLGGSARLVKNGVLGVETAPKYRKDPGFSCWARLGGRPGVRPKSASTPGNPCHDGRSRLGFGAARTGSRARRPIERLMALRRRPAREPQIDEVDPAALLLPAARCVVEVRVLSADWGSGSKARFTDQQRALGAILQSRPAGYCM